MCIDDCNAACYQHNVTVPPYIIFCVYNSRRNEDATVCRNCFIRFVVQDKIIFILKALNLLCMHRDAKWVSVSTYFALLPTKWIGRLKTASAKSSRHLSNKKINKSPAKYLDPRFSSIKTNALQNTLAFSNIEVATHRFIVYAYFTC